MERIGQTRHHLIGPGGTQTQEAAASQLGLRSQVREVILVTSSQAVQPVAQIILQYCHTKVSVPELQP